MPNNKQAKKRLLQAEKSRVTNKTARTMMRSAMKKVLRATNGEEAKSALPYAMKRIDKAAKTSVIHANAAARYKSRLSKLVAAK